MDLNVFDIQPYCKTIDSFYVTRFKDNHLNKANYTFKQIIYLGQIIGFYGLWDAECQIKIILWTHFHDNNFKTSPM